MQPIVRWWPVIVRGTLYAIALFLTEFVTQGGKIIDPEVRAHMGRFDWAMFWAAVFIPMVVGLRMFCDQSLARQTAVLNEQDKLTTQTEANEKL